MTPTLAQVDAAKAVLAHFRDDAPRAYSDEEVLDQAKRIMLGAMREGIVEDLRQVVAECFDDPIRDGKLKAVNP